MFRLTFYPFILFFTFCVYKKNRDVFHPLFVTGVIWSFFPFLYDIISFSSNGYHVLSDYFFMTILSFVLMYALIFKAVYENTTSCYSVVTDSPFRLININILMIFSIIVSTLYLLGIFSVCGTYNIFTAMNAYRIITLAQTELIPTYLKLLDYARMITVPLTCFLIVSNREYNKVLKVAVIIFFFFIPVVLGSKAEILKRTVLFIACFATLKRNNKVMILAALASTVAILLYVIEGRDSITVNSSSNSFFYYIFSYLLSSLPAFDMVLNKEIAISSLVPGERTFYFVFLILSKFGLTNPPTDYKFMYTIPSPNGNLTTNVFTGVGPFYIDFGLLGILIYALLLGILTGFVYKKYKASKSAFFFILHFLILYGVLFQFFGDLIFTYFVTTVMDVVSLVIVLHAAKIYSIDDLKNLFVMKLVKK